MCKRFRIAHNFNTSRKQTYIILTPETHFYIVKLEFTGVGIIFLISALRGSSNEYPQSMI